MHSADGSCEPTVELDSWLSATLSSIKGDLLWAIHAYPVARELGKCPTTQTQHLRTPRHAQRCGMMQKNNVPQSLFIAFGLLRSRLIPVHLERTLLRRDAGQKCGANYPHLVSSDPMWVFFRGFVVWLKRVARRGSPRVRDENGGFDAEHRRSVGPASALP